MCVESPFSLSGPPWRRSLGENWWPDAMPCFDGGGLGALTPEPIEMVMMTTRNCANRRQPVPQLVAHQRPAPVIVNKERAV